MSLYGLLIVYAYTMIMVLIVPQISYIILLEIDAHSLYGLLIVNFGIVDSQQIIE